MTTPDLFLRGRLGWLGGLLLGSTALVAATAAAQTAAHSTAAGFEDAEYRADWGLAAMNASTAYARGFTGKGVLVGVVDTGIEVTHREFVGKLDPRWANFMLSDLNGDPGDPKDVDGHGTHVAGTVGARRDGAGMMGVAFDSRILALRGIPASPPLEETALPGTPSATTAAAIDRAVALGARIINASYGPSFGDSREGAPLLSTTPFGPDDVTEYQALLRAVRQGVIPVFAAGNEFEGQPIVARNPTSAGLLPYVSPATKGDGVYQIINADETPSAATHDFSALKGRLVVVVATDRNNVIADFSNRCGVTADWCVAAPGVDINSTVPNGGYDRLDGTSMAAPHVAGAFAVLAEAFPDLAATELIKTLLTTTTDLGEPGTDAVYGRGLVDLGKASGGPGEIAADGFHATVATRDVTFSNDIGGTGALLKDGGARLTMTGRNSYAGGTRVAAGTLTLNGSLASAVRVDHGARLSGSGTIGAGLVNDGTVAPGNSIGTLTVRGDYVQRAGGRLALEVDGTRGDALAVGGDAVLDGAIDVAIVDGAKVGNLDLRVVSAAGTLSGQLQVGGVTPFLRGSALSGAHDVTLSLRRDFALPADTANQRAVAGHLNASYLTGAQGDLDRVFEALDGLAGAEEGQRALDSLSGRELASLAVAGRHAQTLFAQRIGDRLAQRRAGLTDPATPSLWLSGIGGLSNTRSDGNGPALRSRAAGFALGGDHAVTPDLVGGFAGGYTRGRLTSGEARGDTTAWHAAVYGTATLGSAFVDGLVGYSRGETDVKRRIAVGALDRTATASPASDGVGAAIEAGTALAFGAVTLTPSARLDWQRVAVDSFTERGAGSAGLSVSPKAYDLLAPSIGLSARTSLEAGDTLRVSPQARVRWQHNLGDAAPGMSAGLVGAPGAAFAAEGSRPGRDVGLFGVGLDVAGEQALRVNVGYDLSVSRHQTGHSVTAGLKYAW
ncbi:subtilase-type serine protease [Azospirillum agricola]|uniref:autotransporter domain-containing protein n=1 Tax=Azospirillum agricola TaxID=1720247 RepID=UPI001AE313A3|nr:autotransporter domain-containing protein [Azospirillum agricola]MBP2227703.1 subtilase-type serine protease [Azospirillum agricola]